jgi:Ser/Thr protein kinase RdoA (MazF antagonist)
MFSNRDSISLPAETRELILHVARQFVPLAPDATLVPVSGGFSGAGVWHITGSRGDYALRQWPASGPEVERLRGLHHLLRHVWQQGLHEVAVPLVSRQRGSLAFEGGHWWQLEPWMPGIADFHADPNLERLNSSMFNLARWHTTARTFIADSTATRWFQVWTGPPVGLCERLAKLKAWQSSLAQLAESKLRQTESLSLQYPTLEKILDLTLRLVPRVIVQLEPLVVQNVLLQPCLRDVWHDHLLFQGNRVTGLIDPGACRTDHVASDLSRLLGSLVEDDRVAWRNALDHYQTLRPLTLQDWGLIQAYDQSNVVMSGITWLDWLVLIGRSFPNPEVVEQRLAMILQRLTSLRAA